MMDSLTNVSNLAHLNVTLLHLSQSEVINLFIKFSLFSLDSLWLAECVYNCDLIRIIRQSQRYPRLQSLRLRCWESRGDTTLPLLSICPSSLKKLEVEDCSLFRADLDFIEKNCQYMEEFVYKPTTSDGLLLDHSEDTSGAIKYEDLYRLFLNLPNLRAFHVNELIEPEFLLILCSTLVNINKAKFLMRGINRDRAYYVLKMFYEKVTIRQSFHPFRDEQEGIEESDSDDESDGKRSEIFRAYSNKYLKEWKDAVDEARGRTLQNYSWFFEEYLKPDLSTESSTTKWCLILHYRRKTFPAEIPNFKSVFCNQ
ncbi:unnamed protein product [Auanema sp. JU1783]|nr:unnamed protein product [Auanema sp. JU1783]